MANAVSRRPSPVLGAQPAGLAPTGVTPGGFTDVLKAVLRLPVTLLDLMIDWQQRSEERAAITQLSPHQRRDIGLSQEDLLEMAAKLRWTRSL